MAKLFAPKVDATTMTAMQELASAWVFKRSIQDNVRFQNVGSLFKDKITYDEIVNIWIKASKGKIKNKEEAELSLMEGDWVDNFYKQNDTLLKKIGDPNFTVFTRGATRGFMSGWYDQSDTFMDWVGDYVKNEFKIAKKDNWDPADIWVISGDERQYISEIKDSLEGPHQTISELNKILRGYFKSKEVMGISLKKTGSVAYYEEVNLSGVIRDTSTDNFDVPMSDFISLFNIESKTGMFTQDVKIKVDDPDTNKTFTFQIKANSSNSKTGSNLKFEPTMKGASAARLGKAPVDDVCEILKFIKSSASFVNDYSKYPATALDFKTHPKGESYFRNTVLPALVKGGSKITTDVSDIDTIISNIRESYNSSMDRTTNTRCKLMGLDFFYQVSKLTKNQRNEFVTDMVYLAQKKAFGKRKDFGPFGKIF